MAMEIEQLVKLAPDRIGDTWANRIDYAASLLFVQGYIPESQRKKIADKLNRQFEQGLASGRIVARKAVG